MTQPPFEGLNVSRETLERLTEYHDLVVKWTARINLVSKSSISDLWIRHIWDSAQIMMLPVHGKVWVDIGSGGGFPALVIAILSHETAPDRHVIMIESDQRKAAFLRTVIRELELNAKVVVQRVEDVSPQGADVVSARALADLTDLLGFADRHLNKNGTALFMKGATWEKEVQIASELWSFQCDAHTSKTNPDAAILEIKDIERV